MGEALAFLAVATVVIVTPGPDTALTIKSTLLGGRRAGVATALGVASGQALWALAASVGLAALVAASEPVFRILQLVGAAYLVVLGAQALLAAARSAPRREGAGSPRRSTAGPAFRQGILSNLVNPKMAVFFTSLLPQLAGSHPSFGMLLGLGLALSALTCVWLCAYAVVVARAGELLLRPRVRRATEAVMGAALVALGLRMAAQR